MMPMANIRQISVAGVRVGLVGLDDILEKVAGEALASDEKTAERLLHLVSKANFVTPSRRDEYKTALLREFKRHRGEQVSEDGGSLEIRVYGRGCHNCERLVEGVRAALASLEMCADLEHVTDVSQIVSLGPIGTPALVINGRVVSTGPVPAQADLIRWLKEERK